MSRGTADIVLHGYAIHIYIYIYMQIDKMHIQGK